MLENGVFPMAELVTDVDWTAAKLLKAMDTDGDGEVSRDEFMSAHYDVITLYHGHPCPSFWLGPEFPLGK